MGSPTKMASPLSRLPVNDLALAIAEAKAQEPAKPSARFFTNRAVSREMSVNTGAGMSTTSPMHFWKKSDEEVQGQTSTSRRPSDVVVSGPSGCLSEDEDRPSRGHRFRRPSKEL